MFKKIAGQISGKAEKLFALTELKNDKKKKQNHFIQKNYMQDIEYYMKWLANYLVMPRAEKERLTDFQIHFRDLCILWKQKYVLNYKKEISDIILTAYYRAEGIRYILKDFCEYISEEMEEEADSESLVVAGYNSCMQYAFFEYQKMNDKLLACEEQKPTDQEDNEIFMDLLHEMAYKNDFFSDLYKAWMTGKKRLSGMVVKESDEELHALLKMVCKSVKTYNMERDEAQIIHIIEQMRQEKENIEDFYEQGQVFLEKLSRILTKENKESLRDKEMDLESLKIQYKNLGKELEILFEKY